MTPHAMVRAPAATLRDRLLDWRNALVMSPRFQRLAAAFPPTRAIADAEARGLFDIVAGFVYSQVLAACVKLQVLEILSETPATPAELAARTDLSPQAAERLVLAAAALGLVERRSAGRWGLGLRGAALLGNPGIADMVAHHDMLYADLHDPVALLKGEARETRLGGFWPYARAPDRAGASRAAVEGYTRLMSASNGFVAEDLLDAWPFENARRLMDVGGGDGTFLARAAARHPALEVVLYDLPAVADLARARFAASGLGARATAIGGSFRDEPLPVGADTISLVRVVHDHDDDVALALLKSVRAALPPGGTILVAEPMTGGAGTARMGDAYFGFYLMAMGTGRARTRDDLETLMRNAGFSEIRALRMRRPLLSGLIVGRAGPD